jgi:hypothetical protein
MRVSILGALTAGIVLAVAAGWSYAARPVGQTGYGAPQVLGDQFIKPQNAGSSSWGLWLGLLAALLILGGTGFFGWYRTHHEGA